MDDDEYYVEGVDGFEYEENKENKEEDENDPIMYQKELIAIVKANPILWDKKQKGYKNFNKELAWASVGAILKNISGSDAEKEFYKIRQRYGKERHKVIMSLKGKSGQGAQLTYVPQWELYELCDSFLREVIIPRRTTSNYIKNTTVKSNEIPILPSTLSKIIVSPQNVKIPVAHRVVTPTQIPSNNWTSHFYESSLSSNDATSDSTTFESPGISFQSPAQQTQAQFQCQTPSSIVTQIGPVSREETSAAQQILRTMNQTTAKTVPLPETFNKKKRKINDDLTDTYIKQSEGLNNLAMQVSQALIAKQNPAPTPVASLDPILGAIQMALTKVKDANKFQCMLDILQYINEKYVKIDE